MSTLISGTNGAGKTTLLRVLAGRRPPFAGSVKAADGSRRTLIGDAPALYDYLTVQEHLNLFRKLEGLPAIASKDAIGQFGLSSLANSLAIELSLGQRRRLGLLIATILEPTILLHDEPFNGLDDEGTELVDVTVEAVLKNRGSVILASHTHHDRLNFDQQLQLEPAV